MSFSPTPEQVDCIDKFKAGKPMVVQAYAGAGKTSTCVLMAKATPRFGTYAAFNKAIADEAKQKFPRNVECSTMHALAFRAMKSRYRVEKMAGSVNGGFLAEKLRLQGMSVGTPADSVHIKARGVGFLIAETLKRWQRSDRSEITKGDVPLEGKLATMPDAVTLSFRDHISRQARQLWESMRDPRSDMPMGHDGYLKLWALGNPTIPGDFMFLDEAQDTNPVVLGVVRQQKAQVLGVGDSHQCQPTGTLVTRVIEPARGTRAAQFEHVPIESIRSGDKVLSRSIAQSHLYTNGCTIEETACRPFHGWLVKVTAGSRVSRYTPEHRCVARIAAALEGKHCAYLMRRGEQFRVGMTTGRLESQRGGFGFMIRARQEKPDAFWLLGIHDTPAEARLHEALVAYRYGIPQVLFEPPGGCFGTQEFIDQFWGAIGSRRTQAEACLHAHNLSPDRPLWSSDKPNLIKHRPSVIVAENLVNGMEVFVEGEGWLPIAVERERYTGTVYSLKVAETETYFGDGILTHNSIYEWRGAIDAMSLLPHEVEARLSTSWRFGTEIAGYASKILELLGETVPLKGNLDRPSRLAEIERPDAILTRTNGRLLEELMGALARDKRPYVVGGVDEMLRWVTATERLMACQAVDSPLEFFGFKSWSEVKEASEQEDGAELRRWVRTVDDWGTDALRSALESLPKNEKGADLILSTGHKSKGREWGKVRLCDDFLRGVRTEKDDAEKKPLETLKVPDDADHAAELRLFYVAATRGMEALEVPSALADKLAVLCAKKNVTPRPGFSALKVVEKVRVPQVNGEPASAPTPKPEPHSAREEKAPATNGNCAKPKRRVPITKGDRELILSLLRKERDHFDRISPNCAQRARVDALLAKMEAQL